MRKVLLYVGAVCLIMLAACGESDEQTTNPADDNSEVAEKDTGESEKDKTELNQWLLHPMNQGFGDLSSIMTDSHYSHFAKFHDSFELQEDKDHYILTLTGSGDTFKEFIIGAMKDLIGEEGHQAITSLVKNLSGTYELVFDKQTFHLVALIWIGSKQLTSAWEKPIFRNSPNINMATLIKLTQSLSRKVF